MHQPLRDSAPSCGISFIGDISGLDHGTGHLASMRPPENQRLDTGKG
jgi:hypothetical protein